MMKVLGGEKPVAPISDFEDSYKTQQVLEAAVISATQRRPVMLEEIQ